MKNVRQAVRQENVTQSKENVRQAVRQETKDFVIDKNIYDLIISQIKGNNKITLKEIALVAGVSERTIRRYIKSLPNVKYFGSGYGGYWEILD